MSKASGQMLAQGFGAGLQNLATGFVQGQKVKQNMGIVQDPKATPLQKGLAISSLYGSPMGVQFMKSYEAQQKGQMANALETELGTALKSGPGQAQPPVNTGTPMTAGTSNPPSVSGLMNEFAPQQEAGMNNQPQQVQPQQQQPQDPLEILNYQAETYDKAAQKASSMQLKDTAAKYQHKADEIRKQIVSKEQAASRMYAADVNAAVKEKNRERNVFESDRKYNEDKSADFQKTVSGLRQTIPRKENAQILARKSIESNDLGAFSRDNLANILGRPELRTASGVGLNLAIKENLLTNLSRVSARGTNKWLEQVMIGAFPQTGQSLEANKTAQEAIEAELALDKAEVEVYDRLAAEDMQKQKYVGADIEQRVFKELEPIENEIRDRTAYRTRVIYEDQKDRSQLKDLVNKKAPTGTPLTERMYQVFFEKAMRSNPNPDEAKKLAIEKAKQLGYVVYSPRRVQGFTSDK